MFEYRIKFARERQGITQKEIAELLNINKSTYSNYESERYIIPLKHLVKLANILNVSLDYLFGFNKLTNYKNLTKNINKTITSQRLKEFRKSKKTSQETMANELNNNRTNISGYETGKHLISTSFLYDICKKYNISADYLLGRINEPVNIKNNFK